MGKNIFIILLFAIISVLSFNPFFCIFAVPFITEPKTAQDMKSWPEADLVINHILKRWKMGLYSLIIVAGTPGSGKTRSCVRICEKISEKVNGKNTFTSAQIIDNFLDLIKFVKDAKPEELNLGVVEEVSVLFPSRRAMAASNVDLGALLDTMRKKRVILFANSPVWSQIDSHMRSMGNIYIESIRIFKEAGLVWSKCYWTQCDCQTGKSYKHNFLRNDVEVNQMYALKSDEKTWQEYEHKKDTFLDGVYSRAEARAIKRQQADKKLMDSVAPKDFGGLTARDLRLLAMKEKGMTQMAIAETEGLKQTRISQLFKEITKKMSNSEGNGVLSVIKPQKNPLN